MFLLNKKAPNFKADVVLPNNEFGEIILSKFQGKKNVVLFFYPLDFTFVCPTEIVALSNNIKLFENRDVVIFGISVDSKNTHQAWRSTPINLGGIGSIKFSLISDLDKNISRKYGVLFDEKFSHRATYIIDKGGIIRHISVNDESLGRNINEIIRLIDAMLFAKKYAKVCPVNWIKGGGGMNPSTNGLKEYLKLK